MTQFFKTERDESGVTIVTFDRPDKEMNILSADVLRELNGIVDKLAESDTTGVVFTSGKKDFIAGADIADISSFTTAEAASEGAAAMQGIFQKIHQLPMPTVAAINGTCLGGGTELSLACTWRVATDEASTKIGLPEIQLGLIPGAGGTQRLPRLVGIQAALDMILTGKSIAGKKALKMGLVDACVPVSLLRQEAIKLAGKRRPPKPGIAGLNPATLGKDLPRLATESNPLGRMVMARKAREMIDEKTKGFYPASYKALDAVFDGYSMSLTDGLKLEARLFGELAMTHESQSLIHLFNAITAGKKHPYKDAGKERFGDRPVDLVGVIGSGFMGAGIATVCADKGLRVRLSDPNKEAIGRAMKHAYDFFRDKVRKKRLKSFEATRKLDHISPGLSPQGFGRCDVVIEAVFEDLALKQKLLAQAEEQISPDWVFASNTSALPISDIAAKAKHPERVLGMHFFSPVEKMPLLEIVVTKDTAPWATARAIDVGKVMGKTIIIVKDSPGFYTTRALAFFLAEASNILLEGASIESIDKALTDFGFPVGPITLIDEVGIDVGIHVLETMEKAFPERIAAPRGLEKVQESGRLGRKNSKGFYIYEDGKKGEPDRAIYDMIGREGGKHKISAQEIVDRCLLVFVNESVRCLEEGVLSTPYDGDIGAVFGLGFPPFWGGPFKYVDHVGAAKIVARLEELAGQYGARFKPAARLVELARSGETFYPDEAAHGV